MKKVITNKKSNNFQDKLFRKMSADKRIKLAFNLSEFCFKLNQLNKNNGTRKAII